MYALARREFELQLGLTLLIGFCRADKARTLIVKTGQSQGTNHFARLYDIC
jgi:hypothetical protein